MVKKVLDDNADNELELKGGNSNGAVVRVGDTVRREIGAVSPSVHKLLGLLDALNFDSASRFLGIDKKGRETLSFIAGDCGRSADVKLLDMVGEVLEYMGGEQVLIDSIGADAAQRLKADGHLDHWQAEFAAFNAYRSSIEKNL